MGKTRDFFKKIRDTKGTFHAKMGSIKQPSCDPQKSPDTPGSPEGNTEGPADSYRYDKNYWFDWSEIK